MSTAATHGAGTWILERKKREGNIVHFSRGLRSSQKSNLQIVHTYTAKVVADNSVLHQFIISLSLQTVSTCISDADPASLACCNWRAEHY